jgi:hypothetical protein
MLRVQFAPAATLEPQVLVWVKAAGSWKLLITSGEVPLFVIVTACGALEVPACCVGKTTLVADKTMPGPVPVPLTEIDCGESWALSVIRICPERNPPADGLKPMVIGQLAPCGMVKQLMFAPKSIVSPDACAGESGPTPVLVSVMV